MAHRSIGWLITFALAAGAPAARAQVCDQYAGDPAEGTPEWTQRDADNVAVARPIPDPPPVTRTRAPSSFNPPR